MRTATTARLIHETPYTLIMPHAHPPPPARACNSQMIYLHCQIECKDRFWNKPNRLWLCDLSNSPLLYGVILQLAQCKRKSFYLKALSCAVISKLKHQHRYQYTHLADSRSWPANLSNSREKHSQVDAQPSPQAEASIWIKQCYSKIQTKVHSTHQSVLGNHSQTMVIRQTKGGISFIISTSVPHDLANHSTSVKSAGKKKQGKTDHSAWPLIGRDLDNGHVTRNTNQYRNISYATYNAQ